MLALDERPAQGRQAAAIPAAPPRQDPGGVAVVRVLLGSKLGDNRQLLAIAEAMKRPFRAIPLRFNPGAGLPPVVLGGAPLSWRSEEPMRPPWPAVVLAAGRRSVPAALWIRRKSGGRTRLVHVNRPWAPLSWFDLIVTTPQYALPQRENVLSNLLPFVPCRAPIQACRTRALLNRASRMARPWTIVLLGGDSRPYVFDAEAAERLARRVNTEVRSAGGSAWIVGSPRTSEAALASFERALDVSAHVLRWGEDVNLCPALLHLGDRDVVTIDSASMLADALATGKPVAISDLPKRPDWRWRSAAAWQSLAARHASSVAARALEAALDLGLVTSIRDMGRLHDAMEHAGAIGRPEHTLAIAEREWHNTVVRIEAFFDGF